ncbi:homeodomain interacting protein kinase isoform a [Anaeramoeba flamelloides]|uniref:Homeodomain interacting protein kinase isoform a n=1 Tax=Anaeramoeba flamelloides TaxID=1746091 RepID=A0AAV7ZRU2_9EUKA|nr:homeodomain interacting protein kinase isoform a [Anaeramoeba flamelloides]
MSRRTKTQFYPPKKTYPPIKFDKCCFSDYSLLKNSKIEKNKAVILPKLTINLIPVFKKCNTGFNYLKKQNPRRWITKNNKPRHNQGYDNSKYELILKAHDVLDGGDHRYFVLDGMGSGQFGQVVKCRTLDEEKSLVAIKIVKSHRAYFSQALLEINIHQTLAKYRRKERIVKYLHHFLYKNHLSIVFELLSVNLLQLIKLNRYRGFSIRIVRKLTTQLLDALILLYDTGIVHCDIKPENILLENPKKTNIKIIDFGSACYYHQTCYDYIQSRFYRAPEVILKMKYSQPIDMWSFGCVVAELFLGLPLLPGVSEYEQLLRIIETIGPIPSHILKVGKATTKYFNITDDEYEFKSLEQYAIENQIRATVPKKYFNDKHLAHIIKNTPYRKKLTKEEKKKEKHNRSCLIHFLTGCLQIDPDKRWTPKEAKQHPFITGVPFRKNFKPISERGRLYYTIPKEVFAQQQYISKYFSKSMNITKKRKVHRKSLNSKPKSNKKNTNKNRINNNNRMNNNNNNNNVNNRINNNNNRISMNRLQTSDSSETSSHSEMDIIPNFSVNLNSRFNSPSFMMKRSSKNIESSSGSDSSEFELYMNIRRAKRSFGYGVVSNSDSTSTNQEDNVNSNNLNSPNHNNHNNYYNQKKRRTKLQSLSDGRMETFPSSDDNLEDRIDLINSPQQLNFASKLSLKPKKTGTLKNQKPFHFRRRKKNSKTNTFDSSSNSSTSSTFQFNSNNNNNGNENENENENSDKNNEIDDNNNTNTNDDDKEIEMKSNLSTEYSDKSINLNQQKIKKNKFKKSKTPKTKKKKYHFIIRKKKSKNLKKK